MNEISDNKCAIISSVDCIKDLALNLGWNGVKDANGRRALSLLKEATTLFSDYSFNNVQNAIKKLSTDIVAVFIDVREPSEIRKYVEKLDARTIFIERESTIEISNEADKNVHQFHYDIIIYNTSSKENLRIAAQNFYHTEILE